MEEKKEGVVKKLMGKYKDHSNKMKRLNKMAEENVRKKYPSGPGSRNLMAREVAKEFNRLKKMYKDSEPGVRMKDKRVRSSSEDKKNKAKEMLREMGRGGAENIAKRYHYYNRGKED